jgi:hypothetical protein
MTGSGANGSLNLASLPATERHLIEADKTACLIRYRCAGLKGPEKERQGRVLLAAVPESARDAVVAALKARGSK